MKYTDNCSHVQKADPRETFTYFWTFQKYILGPYSMEWEGVMGGGGGRRGGGEKEHWGMLLSGGGGLPTDRVYSA